MSPVRAHAYPLGNHLDQILALGQRRGAGTPVPGPDQRSQQALEAEPDGPPGSGALGRLLRGKGPDVRLLRHQGSALVRRRNRQQARPPSEPDHPLPDAHPLPGGAARRHQAAAASKAQLRATAEELAADGPGQVRGGLTVRVRDVPPGRLVSVEPGTTLAEVAKRMRRESSDSAAVMSEGRLRGIITERDLVSAIADGGDATARMVDVVL